MYPLIDLYKSISGYITLVAHEKTESAETLSSETATEFYCKYRLDISPNYPFLRFISVWYLLYDNDKFDEKLCYYVIDSISAEYADFGNFSILTQN